jgi:hypothetical protein
MLKSSGTLHTAATADSDSDSAWAETHMTGQEQCFPDSLLLLLVPRLCIDGDVHSIDPRASYRLWAMVGPEALSPYQSAADTFESKQP